MEGRTRRQWKQRRHLLFSLRRLFLEQPELCHFCVCHNVFAFQPSPVSAETKPTSDRALHRDRDKGAHGGSVRTAESPSCFFLSFFFSVFVASSAFSFLLSFFLLSPFLPFSFSLR